LAIEQGNIFESLPEDISKEIVSELVRGDNIKIERIVSKGHSSPASGWQTTNGSRYSKAQQKSPSKMAKR
jgi:cupin 2 domain-containing protein